MWLSKHNLFATLYFNFKMLPFWQAIKLPFVFGGSIHFERLCGKITFNAPVSRGMFKVGFQGCDMFPGLTTTIDIAGELIVGGKNWIGAGSLLRIEPKGICEFHNNSRVGARSLVFSESRITLGENFLTSWDCQIMDTDTHSLIDLNTGKIYPRTAPVFLGKDCWIGNHVIINKGTILPPGSIVASMSLCNKDYTKIAPFNCVLGGIPAKVIAEGKKRHNDKLAK